MTSYLNNLSSRSTPDMPSQLISASTEKQKEKIPRIGGVKHTLSEQSIKDSFKEYEKNLSNTNFSKGKEIARAVDRVVFRPLNINSADKSAKSLIIKNSTGFPCTLTIEGVLEGLSADAKQKKHTYVIVLGANAKENLTEKYQTAFSALKVVSIEILFSKRIYGIDDESAKIHESVEIIDNLNASV